MSRNMEKAPSLIVVLGAIGQSVIISLSESSAMLWKIYLLQCYPQECIHMIHILESLLQEHELNKLKIGAIGVSASVIPLFDILRLPR